MLTSVSHRSNLEPDFAFRDLFALFWKLIPFLICLVYGAYSILEVFFPSLRSANFNRWEIDDNSGTTIQVMGWKKVLSPPRVLASGYLSERTACSIAFGVGALLISIGIFGIRHIADFPGWLPDLFGRF